MSFLKSLFLLTEACGLVLTMSAVQAAPQPQEIPDVSEAAPQDAPIEITCDGEYGLHLQGIASNHRDALFWTYTNVLVKTDLRGKVLQTARSLVHIGDLTWHEGKVYVAACSVYDRPNNYSKVYVYDENDLSKREVKPVPEVNYGAGGIAYYDGHFYLVGGSAEQDDNNYIYKYDESLKYVETYTVPSGHTTLGVQTIAFCEGYLWLGCYSNILLQVSPEGKLLKKHPVDCGYGITPWQGDQVYTAKTPYREEKGSKIWRGVARLGRVDPEKGVIPITPDANGEK